MSAPQSGPQQPERVTVADSRMNKLFDLRYVIGGLLGVYGVILVIRGLVDGPAELARAAGTAINLWTGIALVVVSAVFLAWARWRPLGIEVDEDLGTPAEMADAGVPGDTAGPVDPLDRPSRSG